MASRTSENRLSNTRADEFGGTAVEMSESVSSVRGEPETFAFGTAASNPRHLEAESDNAGRR